MPLHLQDVPSLCYIGCSAESTPVLCSLGPEIPQLLVWHDWQLRCCMKPIGCPYSSLHSLRNHSNQMPATPYGLVSTFSCLHVPLSLCPLAHLLTIHVQICVLVASLLCASLRQEAAQ